MLNASPVPALEAPANCALCSRMVDLRVQCQAAHPDWWNAPVPAMGPATARIAIIGLAPGKQGANRTGQPFTGDASGDLLWAALGDLGMKDHVVILNAVKCLPPGNRPNPEEIRACRPFLKAALDALPNLEVVVALGAIAHQSAVKANGEKLPKRRFAHGAVHQLLNGRVLIDCYHPSRLNQNTGRVTGEMVAEVLSQAVRL